MRALASAGRLGQSGRMARAPRVELRSGGWFGSGTADRVLAMAEELELSEQQQDSIRSARRDYRRAEIERDAQIEVLDLDLDESGFDEALTAELLHVLANRFEIL